MENRKKRFSLKNNRAMINPTPITSSKGIYFLLFFSSPFLIIGIWIMGMSLGYFPLDKSKLHVSTQIFLIIGMAFTLAGVMVSSTALKNLRLYLSKQKFRRRFPNSPWKWDYNWNEKGHEHNLFNRLIYNIFGLALILGLFTPGIYLALEKKGMPLIFKIIIFGFGILFTFIAINQIFKALKFKTVKCLYNHFPFKMDEDNKVQIQGLPHPNKIKELNIDLKCFEFKMTKKKTGNKTTYERVSIERFKQSIEVDKNNIHNGCLDLTINVPEDLNLSTDFIRDDYICWELAVHADIPGIDYNFGFIIPIYK